jgi:protein-tyrosine phosphatase
MTRMLNLDSVDNFRDFGGYPTACGRALRRGRLYRSATHGRATDEDLEAIAALGIGVVVDLRRLPERERDPSRRHPAFAGAIIVNDEDQPDSWHEHIRTSDLSAASFHAYLLGYYRAAPFEPRHVDLFTRYFQALAQTDAPVLIHCAAGKDRTGVLAALTHHVAGVAWDDIVADYLLTNDEARFTRRLPMLNQIMHEISGRDAPPETLRVAMGVEAQYLEASFAEIEARCGDVDAYLETVLGLTAAARERLVEHLVA